MARNLAVSRWRHASAGRRALARTGIPPAAPPPSENHVAVVTALKSLPAPLREAVALHYLADLSVEDIARQTGTAVGTVKARLHRGRRQLAELLRTDSGSSPAPEGAHHG